MKQRLRLTCLLFAICCLLFALLLTACGEEAAAVTDTIVTITFDSNGGTDVDPVQLEKGGKLTTAYLTGKKVPTYTGNRFVGWFDGSTRVTKETTFSKNTTLTAQWVLQITVSFSLGEGVSGNKPGNATIDKDTALGNKYPPNPSRSGWEFKGWFNNGTQYTKDTKITIPENSPSTTFTLTAQWEEDIDHPLEYAEAPAIHPGRHLAEQYPDGLTVKAGAQFTIEKLSSNVERGAGVLSAQWYRATTPPAENNYVGEAVGPIQPATDEYPYELSPKYTGSEPEAGDFWYWVEVTNYNEKATIQKTASTKTMNQLKVTVTEE